MIKAIIFDWGGVLIDGILTDILEYCADEFSHDRTEFIAMHKKYENDFQIDAISEEDIWVKMAEELGKPLPAKTSLWKEAFNKFYHPKEEMFTLVKTLKKNGYKIGFLSNAEPAAMEFFHEQNYDMFHEIIFSCETKLAKPDKRIFEHALKKLKVKPEEAIFIDDNADNIQGAKATKLKAILFQSPDQVKKELKEKYKIKIS